MILQELIKFEEKLLVCENQNKFTMKFKDYTTLDKLLTEIENVTNLFFQLVGDYKAFLNKQDMTNEERNAKLQEFNNNLLNEEVDFDFQPYESFMMTILKNKDE